MSSTSSTTYAHACDMCGKVVTSASSISPHRKLFAKCKVAIYTGRSSGINYSRCDICAECCDRPIIELIEWFERKLEARML